MLLHFLVELTQTTSTIAKVPLIKLYQLNAALHNISSCKYDFVPLKTARRKACSQTKRPSVSCIASKSALDNGGDRNDIDISS